MTWPATIWQANPGPIPVNTRVLPRWANPSCSNPQLWISCLSIYCCLQKSDRKSQNIFFGIFLFFSDVLAVFIMKNKRDAFTIQSWKWLSTARQWFIDMHVEYSEWRLDADVHKYGKCHNYKQNWKRHAPCPILKMNINRASTMFGLASWWICMAIRSRYSSMLYRLPV